MVVYDSSLMLTMQTDPNETVSHSIYNITLCILAIGGRGGGWPWGMHGGYSACQLLVRAGVNQWYGLLMSHSSCHPTLSLLTISQLHDLWQLRDTLHGYMFGADLYRLQLIAIHEALYTPFRWV